MRPMSPPPKWTSASPFRPISVSSSAPMTDRARVPHGSVRRHRCEDSTEEPEVFDDADDSPLYFAVG